MKLKKPAIARAMFFGALAALLLFFAYSLYESYQHACAHEGYPDNGYCTRYRFIPYVLWQFVERLKEVSEVIISLATLALCYFTWVLADSTGKLWEETSNAGKTAERAFFLSQRPRLIVRAIEIKEIRGEGIYVSKTPRIEFQIANIGNVRATIIELRAGYVARVIGKPARKDLKKEHNLPVPVELPCGYSKPQWRALEDIELAGFRIDLSAAIKKQSKLVFFGNAVYLDDSGNRRQMSWYRPYDPVRKSFVVDHDEHDYEYND